MRNLLKYSKGCQSNICSCYFTERHIKVQPVSGAPFPVKSEITAKIIPIKYNNMTKEELGKEIYNLSHLTGEFLLRSGKISNEYFDKYQFESFPNLLKAIGYEMAKLVPSSCEVLAALEMGGIPIATAIAMETGLPLVFVRKKQKNMEQGNFQKVLKLQIEML